MLISCLKADFLKSKRLSIRKAHLIIPLATAVVFTAYYSFSPWDDYNKVDVYYQVLGMALPFLSGLFCAVVAEQEQAAGNFQLMLGAGSKAAPFLSKLLLLLSFCAGALIMAAVVFGAALRLTLHGEPFGLAFHLLAALLLFACSIPLYLLHLYLAFGFNKGVSIGLGLVESLLSALLLTALGDIIWKYVPAAWPARMTAEFVAAYTGDMSARAELAAVGEIVAGVIVLGTAAYLLWASRWDGSKAAD